MIEKILDDREKRYNKVLQIVENFKLPVLCGKINYPGAEKNTDEAKKAFGILKETTIKRFSRYIEYLEILNGYDGQSIIMAVRLNPFEAKSIAVSLEENHELGRIFDIDIYLGEDAPPISREDMGRKPRKCIVCGETARICVKNQSHSFEDVLQTVNKVINNYGEKNED